MLPTAELQNAVKLTAIGGNVQWAMEMRCFHNVK